MSETLLTRPSSRSAVEPPVLRISESAALNLALNIQNERLSTTLQGDYVLQGPGVFDFALVQDASSSADATARVSARYPEVGWSVLASVPAGADWAVVHPDGSTELAYTGLDG